jgi:thymidylate synthase (FAD)
MTFDVLDHGSLSLVTSWGSDESIIEAARMSTGKGFKGWGDICHDCNGKGIIERVTTDGEEVDIKCLICGGKPYKPGDEKLLKFLWDNKHHTPFEMCGFTVEVQAPIFVFREWHRHRTQSYNELSARYTPIPDVNYVPTLDRCMVNAGTNKQAQGTGYPLHELDAANWLHGLADFYKLAEEHYQEGLRIGIPKELARLCIPVGRYSRMRASGNLRNWLAFYALRAASNAQFEIQEYARCIGKVIEEKFPRVWELVNA